MLKPKKKVCRTCGLEKFIWSDGRCAHCANVSSGVQRGLPKSLLKKSPLKSKFRLKATKRGKSKEVRQFYAEMAEKHSSGATSIESGRPIAEVSAVNLAHIFPKERYKSLAINPRNIIILTWEEHTDFDNLLFKHDFEKLEIKFKNSWSIICERVRELLPLCKENGNLKSALEKYLNYEAKI
jgi:hypothetical protein